MSLNERRIAGAVETTTREVEDLWIAVRKLQVEVWQLREETMRRKVRAKNEGMGSPYDPRTGSRAIKR